jgi:two-component system NtrC family sensor kinase
MAMLAVENIHEGIYWLDIDGRILYVNPAAERELGYTADELKRMRVSDIDPNVPQEMWGEGGEISRMLEAGGLHNLVTRHRHRDGHLIPVEVNSGAFDYNGVQYSMAICRDISERLAAEEALRASEAKFSAIFSMTPDPMALARTRDGVLLDVSVSFAEHFGFQHDELVGRSSLPDDLNLWADVAQRQQWRQQLARQGSVLGFEARLRHRDGTLMTVLLSGRAVDMDGEPCVIVVIRDITQRKQMEEMLRHEKAEQAILIGKLKEAQEQLLQSEKLAAIGQLAAGVAHEINNPMGFIRSNLATLREYADGLLNVIAAYEELDCLVQTHPTAGDGIARAKQEADLTFLRDDMRNLIVESIDGADRVRRIVQDLRDFSRIDADEWQCVDLHACLETTINVVWNEIKYKADLVRNYGDLPSVECIPSRLNQVFMNLLVNAAQAIAERGRITITTSRCGDEVQLAFADTGKGIAAEVLPRIFEPFFTTKPVGKGTGLGLSVSYGIVKNHGGRIDAASRPGQGTTFTIRLPISRPPQAEAGGGEVPSAT